MPTRDALDSFWRDWAALTPDRKRLFRVAGGKLIEDFRHGGPIRASMRARPMRDHPGIWEMTWESNDGRATFAYGAEVLPGERHIIWRRIGSHAIYDNP